MLDCYVLDDPAVKADDDAERRMRGQGVANPPPLSAPRPLNTPDAVAPRYDHLAVEARTEFLCMGCISEAGDHLIAVIPPEVTTTLTQ